MKRLISLILVIFAALCLTTCAESIPEPEPDYLYIMACSATAGDISRGLSYTSVAQTQCKAIVKVHGVFSSHRG